LLPLYLSIFPKATVIHIERNPNDVAASLTGKYKAGVGVLDDFDHWKALTEAYNHRVLEYADKCTAYYPISYEDFCTHPKEQTKLLFEFLTLAFTPITEKLLAKVTPNRIGSYQRWQESKQHPLRSKLRSLFSKST
jgi:hypothetical protein